MAKDKEVTFKGLLPATRSVWYPNLDRKGRPVPGFEPGIEVIETGQTVDPFGEESRTIDNLGGRSPMIRTFTVEQRWTQELDVDYSVARTAKVESGVAAKVESGVAAFGADAKASIETVVSLNRPDFRSYREPCPADAGWPDSWSA